MKKAHILWMLLGAGAVVGGVMLYRRTQMSSDEAIEIIAKMKGTKDIEKFKDAVRKYQAQLKEKGKEDFAFIDSFIIKRAKAIKNDERTFNWKGDTYDTKKAVKLK